MELLLDFGGGTNRCGVCLDLHQDKQAVGKLLL